MSDVLGSMDSTAQPVNVFTDGNLDTSLLGSLMRSNDLNSLNSTYNDLLVRSMSRPERVDIDASAAIIQGGLPLILAGIFGGSKGLEAASKPISDLYTRELARAEQNANQRSQQAATAAGLVGKRMNDISDSFEKAAALEERSMRAKEDRESRESIAKDSLAMREAMMGLYAAGRNEDRDRKVAAELSREADRITKGLTKEFEPMVEQARGMRTIAGLLKNPNRYSIGALKSQFPRIMAGEKGVLTEKDVQRQGIGANAASVAQRWSNFLLGDTGAELAPGEIPVLQKVLEQKAKDLEVELSATVKKKFSQAKKMAKLHNQYGAMDELDSMLQDSVPDIISNPFMGMDESGGGVDLSNAAAMELQRRRSGK